MARTQPMTRGYAYLALLYALALVALAASLTVQAGRLATRRQAEDELLFVGAQYRQALRSYQESTPAGSSQQAPHELAELLADPRVPHLKRHLRRLHADPLTGQHRWGLLRNRDGGIVGVYSLAPGEPIRVANFPPDFFHFAGRQRYADWRFAWGLVCTDAGCRL
jgi:type II secretory pathway pseudopilin PulG